MITGLIVWFYLLSSSGSGPFRLLLVCFKLMCFKRSRVNVTDVSVFIHIQYLMIFVGGPAYITLV